VTHSAATRNSTRRRCPAKTSGTYVERVARNKASLGWRIVNWRGLLLQPVLAADTTIELAGELIGKPLDVDDAQRILRRLSGQTHRV
jgi:septum formation protein